MQNLHTYGATDSLNNTRPLSPKALTVLKAASKIFLTHGFSAATTDMIQSEANVSKSTVYTYYKNKESLFIAVVETECALFARRIRSIQFQRLGLREGLMAIANAYLDIILAESGLSLFRVVIAEAPRFPELASRFYQAGPATVDQIVSEKLQDTIASGDIELIGVTPDAAANLFMHLVRSEPQLYSLTHPDAIFSPKQRKIWVSAMVDKFINGWVRTNVS
ncbi:TetR/AcrR family transcriptional regulator [Brenneria populi]|uniref:TetR/AcrR family transcriptional regulator n=1 Tax=Brenneria populi TaxID=1505588 RepID=A0ABU6JQE1_9GAMM|nr:TetR/AcrR family transcriptional regulator [Brenneria populi Li et al. 2015]